MTGFFVVEFIIVLVVSIVWVYLIDRTVTDPTYKDYKGEDFLNWDGKNPWEIEKQKNDKQE